MVSYIIYGLSFQIYCPEVGIRDVTSDLVYSVDDGVF